MAKFVFIEPTRYALSKAICEKAGIDPNYVRRIVIDLQVGDAGVVYVELLGDESMLDVNINEIGVRVIEAPEVTT